MAPRRAIIVVVCIIVVTAVIIWSTRPTDEVTVVFCDVGQGDATLIRWPDGFDLLIDGGPDAKVLGCLGRFLPFTDRTIEVVVMTHPDADHSSGLPLVLDRYTVEQLWRGSHEGSSATVRTLYDIAAAHNVPITPIVAGQQWVIGNTKLTVLSPAVSPPRDPQEKTNNGSAVIRLDVGEESFLFTGDIESPVEAWLVSAGQSLDVDVVKVAHHGSPTSSSAEFITATSPRLAVISVGKENKFGHPSRRVVRRWQQAGATVIRTDQQGSIILKTDGQRLWRPRCLDFWPYSCYTHGETF